MCNDFCSITSFVFNVIAAVLTCLLVFAMFLKPILRRAIAHKEARNDARHKDESAMQTALRTRPTAWIPDSLRTRNRGFTLIELMIVVAIIGIIIAVILPLLGNVGNLRGSGAEANVAANEYYKSMYPEYSDFRVNCVGSDSDGDGYVSCSGRGMKRNTDTWDNLPPVQCAGGGLAAMQRRVSGCKQVGGVIQQQ